MSSGLFLSAGRALLGRRGALLASSASLLLAGVGLRSTAGSDRTLDELSTSTGGSEGGEETGTRTCGTLESRPRL